MKVEAGLALDTEVATKVMGLTVVPDPVNQPRGVSIGSADCRGSDLPRYSTDIGEAMKVGLEMHRRGFEMEIFVGHVSPGAFCSFRKSVDLQWKCYERDASGPDVALATAICKAALIASGVSLT